MSPFKRLHLNLLKIVILLTLKVDIGDQRTRLKTILTIFKYKFVNVNTQRDMNIVVPTVCTISKQNRYHIIHQCFGCVSINILNVVSRKVLMEDLPENIQDLEET